MQRLFGEGVLPGYSDEELVERFARGQDPEVFAAIVARHGPMVMAVCSGHIGSTGDADDAFQATFLILLNRVGAFPVGLSLGGWLYRVARRVAGQARRADARRRRREMAAGSRLETGAECDAERAEIVQIIRQEIDRLLERYRAPLVLCDLHGLTRDEAAQLLGCPAGTVGGRLARARQRLRDRLERRGVSPSFIVPIPPEIALPAGAWRLSLEAAIRATSSLSAGKRAASPVLQLAAQAGRAVIGVPAKLSLVAALIGIAAVGMIAARNDAEPPTPYLKVLTPALRSATARDPDDPKQAGHFVGRVNGPDGRPLAGAKLFIVPGDPRFPPRDPDVVQPGAVRAISGADGRFDFHATDMTYTELDGLPARRKGLLIATADGYAPDWIFTWGQNGRPYGLRGDPKKGADLTLQLARDDVAIHGRLLDHEGRPLAGAQVRLDGLTVPWKRDLGAHLNSKDQVWSFGDEQELPRPYVLPGVAGETITDGDGRFRMTGLGRNRLAELEVTAPRVVTTVLTVMTRDSADVIDRDPDGKPRRTILGAGFTLRLKPSRTVRGIVRDRDTHEPIPGMWVGPDAGRMKYETGSYPTVSDANGRFTITGIDPEGPRPEIFAVSRPGQPYMTAKTVVDGPPLIDCTRGIPFRLKLVDEAGLPVEAEVEYQAVNPNPHLEILARGVFYVDFSFNRAANSGRGIYQGYALPGPGVVFVKTPGRDFRPAHVDPKAFFAPGKSNWTSQELFSAYGNEDEVSIPGTRLDQLDHAAIVLVNPPVGSRPLVLAATVTRDRPRTVTILDPAGKPVVGVRPRGLTSYPFDREPLIRSSTFQLTRIHPERTRRITFVEEDRKLVGFLLARGDDVTPCTVRMQPWGAVTGRILDQNGKRVSATFGPPPVSLGMPPRLQLATHKDPGVGATPDIASDSEGRFKMERLIPGQRYSAEVYRGTGWYAGMAFENLVLQPGEVRNLGDIRTKTPVNVIGK